MKSDLGIWSLGVRGFRATTKSPGELRLERPQYEAEAERRFRRAHELARFQGVRSLELRAATSLALLLRDRGVAAEARALLHPVYDGFSEGFDTADLREAPALLADL